MYYDPIDQGWRDFIKEIRKENIRCNNRLYKVLLRTHGQQWLNSFKSLLPKGEPWHYIGFTNVISGTAIKKEHIGQYIINYSSRDDRHSLFVEVKPNKYLVIKI